MEQSCLCVLRTFLQQLNSANGKTYQVNHYNFNIIIERKYSFPVSPCVIIFHEQKNDWSINSCMMISSNKEKIVSTDYKNERELQDILGNSPELLDEHSKLFTVCNAANELSISSGMVDLFLISETGDVVIVETKLSRNRESRREVIAQIIDYISSLSELSYYELDNATKNRLSAVIDNIDSDIDLPKIIDDNLRSGRIKQIIAVDESNEDLTRLTQFLSVHTDFEIELIEVKKYRDNNRFLYASTEIVKSNKAKVVSRILGKDNEEKLTLLNEIQTKWNSQHPEMQSTSNAREYRDISMPELNRLCSYVFYTPHSRKSKNVQLRFNNHFRDDYTVSTRLTQALKQFDGLELKTRNNIYKVAFKEKTEPTSMVYIEVSSNDALEVVAAMEQLIEVTIEKIKAAYLGD